MFWLLGWALLLGRPSLESLFQLDICNFKMVIFTAVSPLKMNY